MSEQSDHCPKCKSASIYEDGNLWVCAQCFHEWTLESLATEEESPGTASQGFFDANGVELQSGDNVATIKDLKMGKDTLKSGTKAKNIRLLDDPVDGHDISCKIPGYGSVYLKCSVVKKTK